MVLDDGLHPSTRMRIDHVLAVPGRGGFFHDDAKAIAAGAQQEGFSYLGEPTTPGHRKIRQAGEALSVLLVLSDGQVAHGDCAAVQYSGVGGRDPIFSAADARHAVTGAVASLITGSPVDTFRELAAEVDSLQTNGTPLHTAVRYGVTQALLHATALTRHHTMAEVVRDDYDTGVDLRPVPMFVQSGDDRRGAVDKMILKRADVLPHGLINEVSTKLGHDGGLFLAYVTWVRDRILALRDDETYTPTLHFDVYGTIGGAFAEDPERIVSYLEQVEAAARPFLVRVEQPVDAGSTPEQIAAMATLRQRLRLRGSRLQLVVDEWCNTLEDIRLFTAAGAADIIHVKTPDLGSVTNTIEALLHVQQAGFGGYCGGTCNETDRSAQVSAHLAMACGAIQVLAKPGMGVDEGLMIVGNEMARTAALAASRFPHPDPDPRGGAT